MKTSQSYPSRELDRQLIGLTSITVGTLASTGAAEDELRKRHLSGCGGLIIKGTWSKGKEKAAEGREEGCSTVIRCMQIISS